jgi:hypothetical protein
MGFSTRSFKTVRVKNYAINLDVEHPSSNNALKFALSILGQLFEEAKAHFSAQDRELI